MDNNLKLDVLLLVKKVEEVLGNGDWPTTEGDPDEDGNSPLRDLTRRIRLGVGNEQ